MEVTPAQHDALQALAAKHALRLILLFGSHGAGRPHGSSDVDLAVQTRSGGGLSPSAWLDLLADFQDAFPGEQVDLGVIDRADPLFLKKVCESAVLLAGAPRDFQELKIHAFRRYQDHKPYLALEQQFVERFVARR